MVLSHEIKKLIAAANALGAPLYGLDRFSLVAEDIEAKQAARNSSDVFETLLAGQDELDSDILVLVAATYAAWAFVASRYLPEAIAAPLRGDLDDGEGKRANDAVIAGLDVVARRIGKRGAN